MPKRNAFALIAALLLVSCGRAASDNGHFVWDRPVAIPSDLPITRSATCRFKKTLAVSFQAKQVSYSESDENEADTVSFVDLDTSTPKVQSNGGQASVAVVWNTEDSMALLNHPDGSRAAELYTIFKAMGVVIYSKHWDSVLIGPLGEMEMGYCN